jgi:hypothetical protein
MHLFKNKMTALNLASHYNSLRPDWKNRIDYHPVSDFLDSLHTKGILKVAGHDADGMCVYEFNKEGGE